MDKADNSLRAIRDHVTVITELERAAGDNEERLKKELPDIEDDIYTYFKSIRDKIEILEREQIRSLRQKHDIEVSKLEQRRSEHRRCVDIAQNTTGLLDELALKSVENELESCIGKTGDQLPVTISFNIDTSPGTEMTFERFTIQPGYIEVIQKPEDQQKALETMMKESTKVTAGQVAVFGQPRLKYKAIFNGRTATDKRHCWFTGAVILKNGSMLLADRNNNKLKLFSGELSLLLEVDVGGAPFDLALMDTGEMAVTVTKERRVRFVEPYTLSWSSHSIDTDQYCVGIDYQDSRLFVLCESSFKSVRCIKVYDHMKIFLKKIRISDSMTEPSRGYLKVAPSSGVLYFVRNEFIGGNFVCCSDESGKILHSTKLQFRDESPALAILSDLLIVGLPSGLVSIYSTDKTERCLLQSIDKSVPPCAISVDQGQQLAIVTQASRYINSYKNNFVQLLSITHTHTFG